MNKTKLYILYFERILLELNKRLLTWLVYYLYLIKALDSDLQRCVIACSKVMGDSKTSMTCEMLT